jgi:RNA polymerase sigma-70 factor, ECF subfamily
MLDNEELLINRAQNGDPDAFRVLYDHYVGPIFRFIFLKVSSKARAEDLTHDVFLAGWQKINLYQSRGLPFSSWLYRIARNKVIDHYRTNKSHSAIEDVDESLFGIDDDASDSIDSSIKFARIKIHFDKLSPIQKDVTVMRFIEDLSHTEIAKALNKTEGAVRLIQHRAIKNLRSLLEKDDNLKEV